MALVIHFLGLTKCEKIHKVNYLYEFINKHEIPISIIDEFNKNICVIYHSSDNYDLSKLLLDYLSRNKIKSINQCDGIHTKNSDKIIYLKKLLDNHFEELPEYLLFIDSGDTVLDIIQFSSSQKIEFILNTYNCNILFNCDTIDFPYMIMQDEKMFNHTDDYFNEDYIKEQNVENLYDVTYNRYLNSGVFIGKKEYIKEFIDICYNILLEHPNYQSDQFIFKIATRIINNKYNKHFVEVDYNNYLFELQK